MTMVNWHGGVGYWVVAEDDNGLHVVGLFVADEALMFYTSPDSALG